VLKIKAMKDLLVHSCCAPCLTSVKERLEPTYNLAFFWYNPNIYPFSEHEKRKNELYKIRGRQCMNSYDYELEHQRWREYIRGFECEPEGGERCGRCFEFRLKKTAEYALQRKYDLFTTTLTVSPHKNSKVISKIGQQVADASTVNFLSEDFKKKDGYLRSIQLSSLLGLYRQNYCGCEWSLKK
jgi:predicted adenine nucleotide alpha hydrolase (AANH) superfamily ATPase